MSQSGSSFLEIFPERPSIVGTLPEPDKDRWVQAARPFSPTQKSTGPHKAGR
jgi:hypothetical protein